MHLTLPYPPSMNRYWRRAGRHMHLSTEAKQYREVVIKQLEGSEPLTFRLAMRIQMFPPDRRRRDIDNIQKPVLDALQHAGAYIDDEQIDWLLTERCDVVTGGKLIVEIKERPAGRRTRHKLESLFDL